MEPEVRGARGEAGPRETPWGPWATVGFGLLIGVGFVLVQVIPALILALAVIAEGGEYDEDLLVQSILARSGLLLSLATFCGAAAGMGLVAIVVLLRRGPSVRCYLALRWTGAGPLARWLAISLVMIGLWDALTSLIGRPIVPEFMIDSYQTSFFTPLLWMAVVVAAPIFEEVFFRGFLFEGFRCSRLGPAGAVILTSILWAVIHLQYDLYEISSVFVFGVVLGIARSRTDSVLVPIAMHSLNNLVATIEAAVFIHGM